MSREFRKYLWYAVGEIVLVVIGILIALQIDAWYENRQDQQRLVNYLDNIARTISDDLSRVEQLKSVRAVSMFEAYSTILATSEPGDGETDWYGQELVASANAALSKAQQIHYVSANAESFRALELSGLIGAMSDTSLEFMLHDYYRTIDRIVNIERDMNSRIAELAMRFQTVTSSALPAIIMREPLLMWVFEDPSDDVDEEAVAELRELYWDVLTNATTHALLRSTLNEPLMQEYEHLLSLGEQLVHRIRRYPQPARPDDATTSVFGASSHRGHPSILASGRPEYHSYAAFVAPTSSVNIIHALSHLRIQDNALNVRYDGGDPWVYLYFRVGPIEIIVDRLSKDFSAYETIQLELKRETETACSELVLEIKDIEDAERGGLTAVPLTLTPDWHTYTVPLSEFVDADLTNLHVVAGFLMGSEPCRFSIRKIRYH